MQASCIEKGENSFPIHGRNTHRIIYVRYKTLKTFHDTKLLKEKSFRRPYICFNQRITADYWLVNLMYYR